ncbi:hypothetical protein B0H14DRAFT_3178961 [Mycena olivaceomarginata]|nr:hypothetical protein B0H14DRAFT_3178961 [Mycena olivaceomarginata]
MSSKHGQRSGAPASSRKHPAPGDSDGEYDATPAKKARTKKEKAVVQPREPSSRSTRVKEPGKPDKKKAYRTHEEMEAEKDAKVTAAEERDHQCQLLMEKIAALDAEANQAAAAEDASSSRKLDDSDFERVEEDDAYRTEDEFQETKKAKAPVTGAKKPKKGETRNEIEKITKAMEMKAKQEGPKRVVKKVVQDKNAAAASKTAGLSKALHAPRIRKILCRRASSRSEV